MVSEVCRAWMENDPSWMVLDAGSEIPDIAATDGGIHARCARVEVNPLELGGSGGNVDDEGIQKEFIADAAPKGVVLPKGAGNPVWIRSSSLES